MRVEEFSEIDFRASGEQGLETRDVTFAVQVVLSPSVSSYPSSVFPSLIFSDIDFFASGEQVVA